MPTIFFDIETSVSKTVTLKRMSLRNYLSASSVLGMAVAEEDEDPVWFAASELGDLLPELHRMVEDPAYTFVAHNWSFDGRVLVLKLGLPYPVHARCSLEASMCAWPNQPGGYSLDNLAQTLHLPSGDKLGKATDVCKMTPETLAAYCCQDLRLCRDVYRLSASVIPECEWRIFESASRAKECFFNVDQEAVDSAVEGFATLADEEALALVRALEQDPGYQYHETDGHPAVGLENGRARSLRPQQIKRLLVENLAFDTHTIQRKAINPVALAAHEPAKEVIEHSSKANSALSSKRRVATFQGAQVIDAELNAWAAHTGRSASRAVGRGLNLLNLPKHNKEVAKLIRSMFRLPEDVCFVRADEMNVEYRVSCLLAQAPHGIRLFSADRMADPYAAFGSTVLGRPIGRKEPVRQLFKMAVLGLSYLMGKEKWTRELLSAMGKPKADVTVEVLREACEANGWVFPRGRMAATLLGKLGCDPAVLAASFAVHDAFHALHPEFRQTAKWLYDVAELVSQGAGQEAVDSMYAGQLGCPDPDMVRAEVTHAYEGPSVRWHLCGWGHPTVLWRDLGVREVNGKVGLTTMNGKKGYRSFYPSIAIENIIQSAARCRTAQAKLELEERGYPYVFDVHDELLPVVPRTAEAVLQAKADLLAVLGPQRPAPWGWAVAINPDEINVSQSWYEVDVGNLLPPCGTDDKGKPIYPPTSEWWRLLPDHPELLERLP